MKIINYLCRYVYSFNKSISVTSNYFKATFKKLKLHFCCYGGPEVKLSLSGFSQLRPIPWPFEPLLTWVLRSISLHSESAQAAFPLCAGLPRGRWLVPCSLTCFQRNPSGVKLIPLPSYHCGRFSCTATPQVNQFSVNMQIKNVG